MLKKYIRSMLESFVTSKKKWIGEQSIPTSSIVSYQWTPGDWVEIIPPEAGWITVSVRGDAGLRILELGSTNDHPRFATSTTDAGSGYFSAALPVRKGILFKYKISGDVSASNVVVVFHRLQGAS